MKRLFLRRRFFLVRKIVLKRRRYPTNRNEPVDWEKAGKCFERLIRKDVKLIRKLADARTYRDLYLEDGIEPPR